MQGRRAGDKGKFILFLKNNAQTLWLKSGACPGYFFGNNWTATPTGEADLNTEESGVMPMEAMTLMEKEGVL